VEVEGWMTLSFVSHRPWEIGQADDFGLYPVHYAAMNENEASPDILEALFKSNLFAAQQRDRFNSLALHYSARNRGPTSRQDTAFRLHTSTQPCLHRMLCNLLNTTYGYPLGADISDPFRV
jgi:hypothetical protein